ncbi:hypothetical protein STEG23_017366 [Scotinomys teguina]
MRATIFLPREYVNIREKKDRASIRKLSGQFFISRCSGWPGSTASIEVSRPRGGARTGVLKSRELNVLSLLVPGSWMLEVERAENAIGLHRISLGHCALPIPMLVNTDFSSWFTDLIAAKPSIPHATISDLSCSGEEDSSSANRSMLCPGSTLSPKALHAQRPSGIEFLDRERACGALRSLPCLLLFHDMSPYGSIVWLFPVKTQESTIDILCGFSFVLDFPLMFYPDILELSAFKTPGNITFYKQPEQCSSEVSVIKCEEVVEVLRYRPQTIEASKTMTQTKTKTPLSYLSSVQFYSFNYSFKRFLEMLKIQEVRKSECAKLVKESDSEKNIKQVEISTEQQRTEGIEGPSNTDMNLPLPSCKLSGILCILMTDQ